MLQRRQAPGRAASRCDRRKSPAGLSPEKGAVFRALRCDKLILSALQTTVDTYLDGCSAGSLSQPAPPSNLARLRTADSTKPWMARFRCCRCSACQPPNCGRAPGRSSLPWTACHSRRKSAKARRKLAAEPCPAPSFLPSLLTSGHANLPCRNSPRACALALRPSSAIFPETVSNSICARFLRAKMKMSFATFAHCFVNYIGFSADFPPLALQPASCYRITVRTKLLKLGLLCGCLCLADGSQGIDFFEGKTWDRQAAFPCRLATALRRVSLWDKRRKIRLGDPGQEQEGVSRLRCSLSGPQRGW